MANRNLNLQLRSVSPAYIEVKRKAEARLEERADTARRVEEVLQDTFAQAVAKELHYRLMRRRRVSWNPWDWIA